MSAYFSSSEGEVCIFLDGFYSHISTTEVIILKVMYKVLKVMYKVR